MTKKNLIIQEIKCPENKDFYTFFRQLPCSITHKIQLGFHAFGTELSTYTNESFKLQ